MGQCELSARPIAYLALWRVVQHQIRYPHRILTKLLTCALSEEIPALTCVPSSCLSVTYKQKVTRSDSTRAKMFWDATIDSPLT